MSQRGRAPILLIVIMATLGLGLGASGYLNYVQYQRAEQDKKQLQGQITDLRYQLTQNQQLASVKTTPSPSPEPGNSPSSIDAPAVLGTQSVALSQLGVKLSASDPIADLTYAYQPVGVLAVANLTTASLVAKYPACKPGAALGMIVRRPPGSKPATSASKLIKTLGKYNFYYVPPTSNCASDASGRAVVAAAQAALTSTVLPTLSN